MVLFANRKNKMQEIVQKLQGKSSAFCSVGIMFFTSRCDVPFLTALPKIIFRKRQSHRIQA